MRFSKRREFIGETISKDKAPEKSFIRDLKTEYNKIIWLDKETVDKQTVVVLTVSIALGLVIVLMDLIIKFSLSFIL